jgi:putative membrane protein
MSGPKGPVLIDLEDTTPVETPATVAPVPEIADQRSGAAMQTVAAIAARRPSPLAKWFWSLLLTLVGFVVSLAAWDYVNGLIARAPILGMVISALLILFILVLATMAIRELAAIGRLRRVDRVQHAAAAALAAGDLPAARDVISQLEKLFKGRADVAWGQSRMAELEDEVLDADGLLGLAETAVLAPLDARAMREVEAAARQVATVTAIVPLALADVVAALTANLRMIRRIAETYGGRAGTFGSWRLTRTVLTHLVATGAVAVGDDLISSVAGGGIMSKISRRFGEGVINGALTARVGVAAMEVCRPLPFGAEKRPSVTGLLKRSLTGLFNG